MFSIKPLLAALAIGFGTVTSLAPVAAAQGNTTIVIDQAQIMRTSKAGQDIQTKITAIESAMERELQPTADQLNTEGQAIENASKGKTEAELLQDEALKTNVQAYVAKTQEFNRQRQIAAQELQLTERKAWTDFFNGLRPVLQEVVTERNAQVLLDRQDVVFADPSIDATAAVISKLDAAMPTVNVVRQRLPQQAAQSAQ